MEQSQFGTTPSEDSANVLRSFLKPKEQTPSAPESSDDVLRRFATPSTPAQPPLPPIVAATESPTTKKIWNAVGESVDTLAPVQFDETTGLRPGRIPMQVIGGIARGIQSVLPPSRDDKDSFLNKIINYADEDAVKYQKLYNDSVSAIAAPSTVQDSTTTKADPRPTTIGSVVSAAGEGAVRGITTEIPGMVGQALQFAGSKLPDPGGIIENTGKAIKDWSETKGNEWFGSEQPREGLERWAYEGSKMLAPSILPAGIAASGFRALKGVGTIVGLSKAARIAGDVAKADELMGTAQALAKTAGIVGENVSMGLFGLSQAQQTVESAEDRAKLLESQGKISEAQTVRETGKGIAPFITGAIEAAGEKYGTRYLEKMFGLSEAEVVKRGAKQIVFDFLKGLGVEVSTEMGQSGGESAVEKYSGIRPDADPLQEALDVVGPVIFMTMLTGVAGHAHGKMQDKLMERADNKQLISDIGSFQSLDDKIKEGTATEDEVKQHGLLRTKLAAQILPVGYTNNPDVKPDVDMTNAYYSYLQLEVDKDNGKPVDPGTEKQVLGTLEAQGVTGDDLVLEHRIARAYNITDELAEKSKSGELSQDEQKTYDRLNNWLDHVYRTKKVEGTEALPFGVTADGIVYRKESTQATTPVATEIVPQPVVEQPKSQARATLGAENNESAADVLNNVKPPAEPVAEEGVVDITGQPGTEELTPITNNIGTASLPITEEPSAPLNPSGVDQGTYTSPSGKEYQASPVQEIPVSKITLSEDIPQFKYNANKKGVVEELNGDTYKRVPTNPIVLWERNNGNLEVITGRHRLDLAQRLGEHTIPSQVFKESDGFTAKDAMIFDAEQNILENQGSEYDYATYFRKSGISETDAKSRGLIRGDKATSAFILGKQATDATFDSYRSRAISFKQAVAIAAAAPQNDTLQAAGRKMVLEDKRATPLEVSNFIQALSMVKPTQKSAQGDLFGYDDSAINTARDLGKKAASIISKLTADAQTIGSAIRREGRLKLTEDAAQSYGITDRDDMAQLTEARNRIQQDIAAWDNWKTHPELIEKLQESKPVAKTTVVAEPEKPAAKADVKAFENTIQGQLGLVGQSTLPDGTVIKAERQGDRMRYSATYTNGLTSNSPWKVSTDTASTQPLLQILPEGAKSVLTSGTPEWDAWTKANSTEAAQTTDTIAEAKPSEQTIESASPVPGVQGVTELSETAVSATTEEGPLPEGASDIAQAYDQMVAAQQKATRENPNLDEAEKGKRSLRLAMESNRIKKHILGTPTPIELQNEMRRLDSNYVGKVVTTPDGEGTVTGNASFGRHPVNVNGTIKHYEPDRLSAPKATASDAIESLRRTAERDARSHIEVFGKYHGVEFPAETAAQTHPGVAPVEPSPATAVAKQPWEMTPEEFVGNKTGDAKQVALSAHPQLVKNAIAAGKVIPPEVLEKYKHNQWAQNAIHQVTTPTSQTGLSSVTAKRLLSLPTERRVDAFGPANIELRQQILQELTGEKVPKSKAGATRVRDELARAAGIDRLNKAGVVVEREIEAWLRTIAGENVAERGTENGQVQTETPVEDKHPAVAKIDEAAAEANPEPSPAQAESGKYAKGHPEPVLVHGLQISIETAKDGTRKAKDGSWEVKMPFHYGHILGTIGADGDQVDVTIGEKPESDKAFIIDQKDLETGRFDEHKTFINFGTKEDARAAYIASFSDGKGSDRIMGITEMSMDDFKAWLQEDHSQRVSKAYKGNLAGLEASAFGESIKWENKETRTEFELNAPEIAANPTRYWEGGIRHKGWAQEAQKFNTKEEAIKWLENYDIGKINPEHWGPGEQFFREMFGDNFDEEVRNKITPDNEAVVRAAIDEAKKNGPSPEFRALFGGIAPDVAGTTPEKVAALAEQLGLTYREETRPTAAEILGKGKEQGLAGMPTAAQDFTLTSPGQATSGALQPAKAATPTQDMFGAQEKTASKPAPAPYGSGNKLVSIDAAEAARKRMRERLGGINTGAMMDPQMIADGATLAVFHIEAGARSFTAYARKMIEDFGDVIRPYLKSFYSSAYHYPGVDKDSMTPLTEMADIDENAITLIDKSVFGTREEFIQRMDALPDGTIFYIPEEVGSNEYNPLVKQGDQLVDEQFGSDSPFRNITFRDLWADIQEETNVGPLQLFKTAIWDRVPDLVRQVEPTENKVSAQPMTIADHTIFKKSLIDGTATVEAYKSAFDNFMENQESLASELSKMTKAQLLKRLDAMMAYRYKNDKKEFIVRGVLRNMQNRFVLGRDFSFMPYGDSDQSEMAVLKRMVASTTEQDLKNYAARFNQPVQPEIKKEAVSVPSLTHPMSKNDTGYYLSSGDTNAIYTLRKNVQIQSSTVTARNDKMDSFVTNLSTEKDIAEAKAKEYIVLHETDPAMRRLFTGEIDEDLRDIDRSAPTQQPYDADKHDDVPASVPIKLEDMSAADILAQHGLVVEEVIAKSGKPYWPVSGNTRTHEALLNDLGAAQPRKIGGKWVRSFFNGDPTDNIANALVGKIETKSMPTLERTDAEFYIKDRAGLNLKFENGKWHVTGKSTYDYREALNEAGGAWSGDKSTGYVFASDPTERLGASIKAFIERSVNGQGVPGDAGTVGSETEVARLSELREREDGRRDERITPEVVDQYINTPTKDLLQRGAKYGVPQEVIDNQVEDVAAVHLAFLNGKPMYLLANGAGTGKTFILGGVIRELRASGEHKFVYVTQSQDLIGQIKADLSDYGISDVAFHTYAEMSTHGGLDTKDAILIFDESQNVKNVDDAARGILGQKLMASAKFTIISSATPYQNPVEAQYLAGTGIFEGVGGFSDWAKMYGAAVRKVYNPETRRNDLEIVYWPGRGKKKDGAAARQWMLKQGIMSNRPMKLDPSMVESRFNRQAVDQKWVDTYDQVRAAYDAVLNSWMDEDGNPRDNKITAEISRHRENAIKRILEASKVTAAISRAKEILDEGKNIVIFVETKSDRHLGRWKKSAFWKEDTLHTFPQMQELMSEWEREVAMARMMDEKPPPRPFAAFIYEIARTFHEFGIDHPLPSVADELQEALKQYGVGIYTGDVTTQQATRNKTDFLAGRTKVLIATMAKGGAGLSLHDVVGNRPTVQLNINLPWTAWQVDQVAARVARYGLQSKATIEWLFASNIPWETNKLAPRVGGRMSDMGAIVHGVEVKAAEKLLGDFDFEGLYDVKQVAGEGLIDLEGEDGAPEYGTDEYAIANRLENNRSKASDTSGGFFATPFPLSVLMKNISGVRYGERLLEPEAGSGHLLKFIPDGVSVTAIEKRPDNFEVLTKSYGANNNFTIQKGDFLDHDVSNKYDVILMNPPFERIPTVGAQDIAHVQKAYDHLDEGGRLVAIMGEGAFFRSMKQDTAFRDWLDEVGATVVKLPDGAFKKSGTMVRTRMVIIDRDNANFRSDIDLQDMSPNNLREVADAIPVRVRDEGRIPERQLLADELRSIPDETGVDKDHLARVVTGNLDGEHITDADRESYRKDADVLLNNITDPVEHSTVAAIAAGVQASGENAKINRETEAIKTAMETSTPLPRVFNVGDIVLIGEKSKGKILTPVDSQGMVRINLEGTPPRASQRIHVGHLQHFGEGNVAFAQAVETALQGVEAGETGFEKRKMLALLGRKMYEQNVIGVAIKEMMQNSFDTVKEAVEKGILKKHGNITIEYNSSERTIAVTDNGMGMSRDTIKENFLKIGGSKKELADPSGALGLAKIVFLFSPTKIRLDTYHNGVHNFVDATRDELIDNQFVIDDAKAEKGKRGTTLKLWFPEREGEEIIRFPYRSNSPTIFSQPLIGPVEVKTIYDGYEEKQPLGINWKPKGYDVRAASFDWGTATIYFGIERQERAYSAKHQVLSSGIYQFDNEFNVRPFEKIPYNIIVDIRPKVNAAHIDYPFNNSREGFQKRIQPDIERLEAYLAQIARGEEARDLKDNFKNIKNLPRIEEAGQMPWEQADTDAAAELLKADAFRRAAREAFDRDKEANQPPPPPPPVAVKIDKDGVSALPPEAQPTGMDKLTPQEQKKVLDDAVKAIEDITTQLNNIIPQKEVENRRSASFEADQKAPDIEDFMLDPKYDRASPIFHNNLNKDLIKIGDAAGGDPQLLFSEVASIFVEMKEVLAKSQLWGYDKLNNFFAGISLDKGYAGIHIRVPYQATYLNPFYFVGKQPGTVFSIRGHWYRTMVHELAHTGDMNHGVGHNQEMASLETFLQDNGMEEYFRDALLNVLVKHEKAYSAMRSEYDKSTTKNATKGLKEFEGKEFANKPSGDTAYSGGSVGGTPIQLAYSRGVVPSGERSGRSGDLLGDTGGSGAPGELRGGGSEVRGDETTGVVVPISAEDFAKSLEEKYPVSVRLYKTSQGDLKLDNIVIPKGERKSGVGTKVMQDIVDYADQNNLRVILTTATKGDSFGTTSMGRLKKFYKRFGFVENKGKDYRISENMFRRPEPKEQYAIQKQQEDTPQFKAWFKQSKAVDEDGNPIVLYHGTNKDITVFNVGERSFDEEGNPLPGSGGDPMSHLGSHFAEEPEVANKFAKGMYGERFGSGPGEVGGSVYPVYLSIQNPLEANEINVQTAMAEMNVDTHAVERILEDPSSLPDETLHVDNLGELYDKYDFVRKAVNEAAMERDLNDDEPTFETANAVARAYLQKLKDAGYDGIKYSNMVEGGTSWVAFYPNQVKSAIGNSGEFNPDNPDIRYGVEGQEGSGYTPTLEEAKAIFKGATVTQDKDGKIWVSTPAGTVSIESVDQITPNEMSLKIGYGKDIRGTIAGSYTRPMNTGEIKISKLASGEWALRHESIHFLEDFGLITKADMATLNARIQKEGKWDESKSAAENRAIWLTDFIDGPKPQQTVLAQIWQKIKDFVAGLVGIRTPEMLAQDIRTGDIYQKDNAAMAEDSPESFAKEQQIDTPAFKQWFGESKVVDENGKPLRAYHGTAGNFTAFDTQRHNDKAANLAWSGDLGSWFTAPSLYSGNYDEENAEYQAGSYAETSEKTPGAVADPNGYTHWKQGANTMPVYLAISNPMEYEGWEDFDDDRQRNGSRVTSESFRKNLIAKGYDGIVIRNSETDGNVDRDDWVAFYPEQIKSAIGNRGTFDKTNPDITYAIEQYAINVPAVKQKADDAVKLVTPGIEFLGGMKSGLQTLLLPTSKSKQHLAAAEVIGKYLGSWNRDSSMTAAALDKAELMFTKAGAYNKDIPLADNIGMKFASAMSTDISKLPPDQQEIAKTIESIFQQMLSDLRKAGAPLQTIRENYFPGMWTRDSIRAFNQAIEDAFAAGIGTQDSDLNDWTTKQKDWVKERVEKLLVDGKGSDKDALTYLARRPFKGSETFRKQKTFDDIMTAVEFGLRPITANPISLVELKLAEMGRSLMANRSLRELEAKGDVIEIPYNAPTPEGLVRIKDRYGEVWGPPVMPVWQLLQAIAKTGKKDLFFAEFGKELFSNDEMKQELKGLYWENRDGDDYNVHQMHYASGKSYSTLVLENLLKNHDEFKAIAPTIYEKLEELSADSIKLKEILGTPTFNDLTQKLPVGGFVLKGYRVAKAPVAEILNNYLSSSLYNNPYVGKIFQAHMGIANVLNQSQLGVLSAFHAGFTTVEVTLTQLGEAMKELYGVTVAGNRTMSDVMKAIKKIPTAFYQAPMEGARILKEWETPTMNIPADAAVGQFLTDDGTRVALIARAAEIAGGGFKLERGLQTDWSDKAIQEWYGGQKIKAALRSPVAFIELTAKPVLEWLVPRQKASVFASLAGRIIEMNQDKTLNELAPELRQAWDRLDARMGQVQYDRLFINNTAKNVVQALIRAPGWTGGTIAEIGGSLKDAGKFLQEWITTGKAPENMPDRVAYTVSLMVGVALTNALLTMLFTGEPPEDEDYWAFRDGSLDERGKPSRWLLPTYLKDVKAYTEDPKKVIYAKTHPLLSLLKDIDNNRDYYGVQIRNPEDSTLKQAGSLAGYVAKQFVPFWMRGAGKESERGGGFVKTMTTEPQKLIAPLVGVMPAPAAYNSTAFEKYSSSLKGTFERTSAQFEKAQLKQQLAMSLRRGDADAQEKIMAAVKDHRIGYRDPVDIRHMAQTPPAVNSAKSMSLEELATGLKKYANDEEKELLLPVFVTKFRNKVRDLDPETQQEYLKIIKDIQAGPEDKNPTETTAKGEKAYADIRSEVFDWLKKHGEIKPYVAPTNKSNALYYYRQAKKFGDNDNASKYLKKYEEFGGDPLAVDEKYPPVHPLSSLRLIDRHKFKASLSADQRDALEMATHWYKAQEHRSGATM